MLAAPAGWSVPQDSRRAERERMVREQIEQRGVSDPRVLEAMRKVARHDFVLPAYQDLAYQDHPLPIEAGQTISQPYIVALMTELLRPQKTDRVLEVGTGSGYQAAVLSGLVKQVYSIEIVEELATSARQRLRRLGYNNVEVRHGDGYAGWPEQAPFDKIIVTAAPETLPTALVAQLKPGGRLVVPVGVRFAQELLLVEKDKEGKTRSRTVLPVSFVPMVKPSRKPAPPPSAQGDGQAPVEAPVEAARGELNRAQARAEKMHQAFHAGAVTRAEVEAAEKVVNEARERFERLAAGPRRLTPALAVEERKRAEARLEAVRERARKMSALEKAGALSRREFEEAQAAVREAEKFLELALWREQELNHEWELEKRIEAWRARGGRFDEDILASLQTDFLRRFGHPLPVSALGMTETHAELNFNHAGRVDVALHPDSAEGRWLIAQLESRDIPYIAFRNAVAHKATGAHIHLGLPSPRLT